MLKVGRLERDPKSSSSDEMEGVFRIAASVVEGWLDMKFSCLIADAPVVVAAASMNHSCSQVARIL